MPRPATDVRRAEHRAGHRLIRWVAVVFVALVVAAGLGSAGAWRGWQGADPLPSDQRATQIVAEVLPGAAVGRTERWDALFDNPAPDWVTRLISDDEYDGGSVLVPVPVGDIAVVRGTLERDGWQVPPAVSSERLSDAETVEFVTAHRDRVELTVFRSSWDGGEGVVLQRPEPALVRPMALAGGVFGLLLGAGMAVRFTGRHVGRRPWNTPAWRGGALLALPSIAALSELVSPTRAVPPDVPGAPWEGYVVFKLLTTFGLLSWGHAVVLRLRARAAE